MNYVYIIMSMAFLHVLVVEFVDGTHGCNWKWLFHNFVHTCILTLENNNLDFFFFRLT
jgi:hypothetical protein